MARKILVVAAILTLLASADTAWAVLMTASIVLTDHGQAIPGATITLSRPHPRRARAIVSNRQVSQQPIQQAPQPPIAAPPVQAPPSAVQPTMDQTWLAAKSDQTGRVRLQFDDKDLLPETELDMIVTYANGATYRRFNVPIESIRDGGVLEVTEIGTATVEPAGATTASTAPPIDLAIIPAPPPQMIESSAHQAQQDLNDPERAYEPTTGQALFFDRNKKSWIDQTTGQAIGFAGALAADGTIIPAPPVVTARSGNKHQAQQDKNNPERAYDPVTGETLIWDRARNTWIDTKTQRVVGFQGAYVSGTAGPGPSPVGDMSGSPSPPAGFGFGFGFGSGGKNDQSDRMQPERRTIPKQ